MDMIKLITVPMGPGIGGYIQEMKRRLNVEYIELELPSSFKEAFDFIRTLRKNRDSILHFLSENLAKYALFSGASYIITIHDMVGYAIPTHEPVSLRWEKIYSKFDVIGFKKAKHIIAISENTKKDVINYLGLPEEKISVIHLGINHDIFYPRKESIFYRFKYILFVGGEWTNKNLAGLLKAFYKLKKEKRIDNIKLIKIGGDAGFRERTLAMIRNLELESDIVFEGFVLGDKLPFYYSSAECLVFPSLYEGFGLPILEAMACGCPVISSNVSSLPEVVGDAGIVVDPYDVNGLAEAIYEVSTNDSLRKEMIKKGLERAKMFSWEKCAKETLKVYEEVYNGD